jgi:hypothetical protein
MSLPIQAVLLFLTLILGTAFAGHTALAHRFDIVLVIPLSDGVSTQGQQILDGFMLATAERDSHPDQESDGHLGGLDVYVTVIDGEGDVTADIARVTARGEVAIVAAFGTQTTLSLIKRLLDGKGIALLPPGQSPFSEPGLPAVAAFISAYEKKYGIGPSSDAARGYNAARRIDTAVRAQGGADDTASLLRNFGETAQGFAW